MSNSVLNRRNKLYAENPRCYWCTKITINQFVPNGQKTPAATATLDHLQSRLMGRTTQDIHNTVLSCYSCNQMRAKIESKMLAGKPYAHLERNWKEYCAKEHAKTQAILAGLRWERI